MDDRKKKSLLSWISFLGVVYRIVIILGILFCIGTAVVLILTRIFPLWVLCFPLGVILFGVILARIEYALYRMLETH